MKSNIYYRHACLTKLALTISLLFVALWFFLFSSLSFGNPESVAVYSVVDTDNNLSVPVLAEKALLLPRKDKAGDQARESTLEKRPDALGLKRPLSQDSRGAQNPLNNLSVIPQIQTRREKAVVSRDAQNSLASKL